MQHQFDTGFARLLSKLGIAGRLQSMGANDLKGTHSYTAVYAPGKTLTVTIKEYDWFTEYDRRLRKNPVDKGGAQGQHPRGRST